MQLQVVQPAAILQRDPRRLPQNLAHRGRLLAVERAQPDHRAGRADHRDLHDDLRDAAGRDELYKNRSSRKTDSQ